MTPLRLLRLEETAVTNQKVGGESESPGTEPEVGTSEMQNGNTEGVGAGMIVDTDDIGPCPQGKTDSPSRRKGHFLGSELYLNFGQY